ncbi:uncharacterized protein LOC122260313 [Penaeus japonicus]|uniref:uncharacterized protein LOC122260313 n=1 Tax=Penaeus japonicus TaxID=27405 RepID=UPI001C7157A4|nr:uncharacterized protein LOC122260313 [Penaeus japonicus]
MGDMVFVEKSGFRVLQEILKGYPEDFPHKPEEVMLEAFRLALDFWRGLDIMYGIDYDELCECDMMAIFDHVLSEVSAYFQNGGNAVTNEEFLHDLCVLGEDVVVPDKTRLEALTLAEKYLQLDEKTKDLLDTLRRGEEVTSE